jgi:hypothetical protein
VTSSGPTSLRSRWNRFVEPAVTGLPTWRVMAWFPAIVAFGALVLIALGISGTSSGAYWREFGEGVDPDAVLGGPRLIRSDEWLVNQSWIISQAQQGYPTVNGTFPGGMDATVGMELPAWDWVTLFRPHLWGHLLFGPEYGTAWQWWIPALGLVTATYLFVVTILPRRPATAALVACVVYFSPIFQWWYGPNALWPTAWALLATTATIWMLRDPRLRVRIAWAVVVGWLAVTAAIGLYVPFLVPPVLIFVALFLGLVLARRPWGTRFRPTVRALGPMLIAGVAAVAVVLAWVASRLPSFAAIGATVYPGARSDPSGALLREDPTLLGLFGAPFGQSFATVGGPTVLGPNPSEASTAILFALFVLPGFAYLIVRAWRRERRLDGLEIGAVAVLVLVLAFLLVPGWDPLARLLLLDRVPVSRFRVGFAALLPVFFALVVRNVDRLPAPRLWVPAIGTAVGVGLITVLLYVELSDLSPEVLDSARLWPVAAVAIALACGLVFVPRLAPAAAGVLLVASLAIGAAVNPLYRGVYDLNDTEIGEAIHAVDDGGAWVGVGSYLTMALVMQTGVDGYNGVQMYPPEETWEQIDPDGSDENVWNRLAHVRWTWGSGDPVFTASQRDQILGQFDACSDFAQTHVSYVVSDETPPSDACLEQLDDVEQGRTDFQIYRIVPEESR